MVLSSWPWSLRKFTQFIWWMQTERRVAANPQTKPTDLDCVCLPINGCYHPHPPSPFVIITRLKADTHFNVPRRVEGWVDLGTAGRVRSPCPRLLLLFSGLSFSWTCVIQFLLGSFTCSRRERLGTSCTQRDIKGFIRPKLDLNNWCTIWVCR